MPSIKPIWRRKIEMEDREIRAALDLHWAASDASDFEVEHQIYREDAILEYPQSGERIHGRQHIQMSRAAQPNRKRFTVRRTSALATFGSPNSSSLRWATVLRCEHHGTERREGHSRDPIFRRCLRAGAVTRSMGRADAVRFQDGGQ